MMRNNLGKVMERGERIDSLLDKTSALKAESVWNLVELLKQQSDTRRVLFGVSFEITSRQNSGFDHIS